MSPGELKKIGEGYDKIVFEDPVDPEHKVLAEIKERTNLSEKPESVPQTKSRYYLGKILHLLLPDEIPDIYLAATKPGKHIRSERRGVDELHSQMQEILSESGPLFEAERKVRKIEKKRETDPSVKELKKRLKAIGLTDNHMDIDMGRNYAYSSEGQIQYLDNIPFWVDQAEGKSPNVNMKKLLSAINKLKGDKKEAALKYLHRLALALEEDSK